MISILGLLAAGAGVLGIGEHLRANELNQLSKFSLAQAKARYEETLTELDICKEKCEDYIEEFGEHKQEVLNHNMKEFLNVYEKIKRVELKTTKNNENVNFDFNSHDADTMVVFSDIYAEGLSSSIAGATAGTIISLAVSGSIPVVAGEIGLAAELAGVGEIGLATEFLGGAVASSVSVTPLVAIVGPIMMFSGISASSKADENMEKVTMTEVRIDDLVAKMELRKTFCTALTQRVKMLDELLINLNRYFGEVILKVIGVFENKDGEEYCTKDFTDDELEIIASARAIAGAVKAIIDTPVLTSEGQLTDESQTLCEKSDEFLSKIANIK